MEETAKFVGANDAKKRLRMRERWMRALNDDGYYPNVEYHPNGEYHPDGEYHPEGLYMAGHNDLDRRDSRSSVYSHYSHSVYSQDMKMVWQEPETYSIRNSV